MMNHIPPSLIFDKAQTLTKQGKFDDASVLLESILEIDPQSKLALRALASIRMLQKRPRDAAHLLELALGRISRDVFSSINAINKPFGNEDAEYLKQEQEQQTSRREYDPFSELLSLHNNQTSSPISEENLAVENECDEVNDQEVSGVALLDKTETPIDINHELENDDSQNDKDYLFDLMIDDETFPPELDLVKKTDNVSNHEEEEWEDHTIVTDEIIEDATWEDLLDPHLIELPPNPREIAEIPDRLTRKERARQIAMNVGEEFGWERKGIELLAVIFDRYYWSAAQAAIRRGIEGGMTPFELELAEEVRQIWYQHPEYWAALDGLGDIVQRYSVVSWPSVLYIIRSFKGYPQSEEVCSGLIKTHTSIGLKFTWRGNAHEQATQALRSRI